MGRFIRTAKAEEDLIEIWIYIAADNLTAADRLVDQIDTKCQMLADNPELGQARPDIAPGAAKAPIFSANLPESSGIHS
ncbi:type II toxin-antitoxin system RelE/ParE family toxin [uncultured Nostoc sp.]|uniref:type II toxin-antitoxin system RelE/ParE family toxin n=1 Tax=uncultured Nostoc sp. TaxID=340711 RepID=UPI0035CBDEA2